MGAEHLFSESEVAPFIESGRDVVEKLRDAMFHRPA